MTASTATGQTISLPVRITSAIRPNTWSSPEGVSAPASPVRNHPASSFGLPPGR